MNEELQQELEALQVLNQFLDKLIPNMENLCRELRGASKPDTQAFKKQCLDAFNWTIEIYNRVPHVFELCGEKLDKEETNQVILSLGEAVKTGDDAATAERIENGALIILHRLKKMTENKI